MKQKKPKKQKNRKNKKMIRMLLLSFIGVLLLTGAVGGLIFYRQKTQKKVEVYPIATLNCADWWESDATLSGVLSSDYVQEVQLESGREVKKVYVKVGDVVKPGDKLLKYNMEEQELDLQLQELQMKSSEMNIKKLEDELNKLKNTKTKGSVDGSSDVALSSPYGMLSIQEDQIRFLAEADTDTSEEEEAAKKAEEEAKKKAEEEAKKAEEEAKKKAEEEAKKRAEEEAKKAEEEAQKKAEEEAEKKEQDTNTEAAQGGDSTETGSGEDTTEVGPEEGSTEEKSEEGSTEEPEPTPPTPEKDIPVSKTISSLDDRAKNSSGDGKTEENPYVFLLVKNAEGESIDIVGKVISELIEQKIYAVFKEYDSMEAYDENPGQPSSEITVTPTIQFSETISERAKYTIEDLKQLQVTISKLEITPFRNTVKTGESYSFAAKVTGHNIRNLTARWSVSGNKSKDTIISGGTLWVALNETSSKIKVTVEVGAKTTSMTMAVQKAVIDDDDDDDNGGGNGGSGNGGSDISGGGGTEQSYTAEELKEAIADKENEISQAKTELSEAKINYQEAKKEVDAGLVKAKIGGTVKTAYGIDELPDEGSPVIVIRADDGIYVKTQVNEMDLDSVKVGGTITCSSWESDAKYEAIVKEVSDYPTSNTEYVGSDSNPNSSYYPVVAYIENAEGLSPGDTVNISYSSKSMGTENADAIYLQKAYVRSDSDGSYVFKVNVKNRLEKQYIKTGKTLNGQYIQITGGISEDDFICFPYGKQVKEGAKTKVSESDENIIY